MLLRLPSYVVLFPPKVSIGDTVARAMLFYPGFLVDPVAYVPLLGGLSDRGILVVVVNTEPLRMATPWNGYGPEPVHGQPIPQFEVTP